MSEVNVNIEQQANVMTLTFIFSTRDEARALAEETMEQMEQGNKIEIALSNVHDFRRYGAK